MLLLQRGLIVSKANVYINLFFLFFVEGLRIRYAIEILAIIGILKSHPHTHGILHSHTK